MESVGERRFKDIPQVSGWETESVLFQDKNKRVRIPQERPTVRAEPVEGEMSADISWSCSSHREISRFAALGVVSTEHRFAIYQLRLEEEPRGKKLI